MYSRATFEAGIQTQPGGATRDALHRMGLSLILVIRESRDELCSSCPVF